MEPKKHIEAVFHSINNYTTINNSDRQETTANFNMVRDYILQKMRDENPLFKNLTRGHCLAGSYADNVKICLSNEFDLLLPIEIAFPKEVKITADEKRPGNVLINIKKSIEKCEADPNKQFIHKCLKKMVDKNGFLRQYKVQSWIQGVLDKIEMHGAVFHKNGKRFELSYRISGPAHTCHVKTSPYDFDIDLVPAFMFKVDKSVSFRKCPHDFNGQWQAIAKPLRRETVEVNQNNISFQGSYAEVERKLIAGKNNLKNSLRMLKKLKERQNHYGPFKSYFIKTMFLWENDKQDAVFWNKPLPELVFYMIEKWVEYLKKGKLPFYWDRRCNLLANENCTKMAEQLEALYKDLMKLKTNDPERILEKFLTEDELQSLKAKTKTVSFHHHHHHSFRENEEKENSTGVLDTLVKFLTSLFM